MAKIVRKITSGVVALSPNFYLSEFTMDLEAIRIGIDNTPDPLAVQNLFKLATLMEQVRAVLGNKAIRVFTGYRSMAVEAMTGRPFCDDYLRGERCDFVCNAFGNPAQIIAAIEKSKLKFGELLSFGDSWVTISLPAEASA